MAYELGKLVISLPKAADFTSKQFRFGKVDSSGNVAVAGLDQPAIGVIDDNGSVVGSATPVIYGGVAQVLFGASANPGDELVSDSNGAAVPRATGENHVIGIALEAGSSGSVGAMLVQPRSYS